MAGAKDSRGSGSPTPLDTTRERGLRRSGRADPRSRRRRVRRPPPPSRSTKKRYWPRRSLRGRDSILVRFTPRNANSERQRTSHPDSPAPAPAEDQRGLRAAPASGAVPAGATQTKRVSLPAWSSIPSRRTTQPYSSAARGVPIAAHGSRRGRRSRGRPRPSSSTRSASPTAARVRRKPAHCASACGMRGDGRDPVERQLGARDEGVARSGARPRRRSSRRARRRARRASRRPSPRSRSRSGRRRARPSPSCTARTTASTVGERHGLGAGGRGGEQGLLAEGPLRPEVRGPHDGDGASAGVLSAIRTASSSSGASSSSPRPSVTCLA